MIRSTVGYWHETIDPAIDPPLRGAAHVDVAIVGGGFTGLATAYELKRAAPHLRVAVLEAETIGYGASGRNGGFAMTLFGLQMSVTAARFGKRHAREAHRYMERAVDRVGELVRQHAIDCDYELTGLITVANAPAQAKRLRHEVRLARELGLEGIEWLDAAETRRRVDSPLYLGARAEARCALVKARNAHLARLFEQSEQRAERLRSDLQRVALQEQALNARQQQARRELTRLEGLRVAAQAQLNKSARQAHQLMLAENEGLPHLLGR